RSDYPNQVNNALCFPYIFRGALDVGATAINEEMKLACVHAIAALAKMESGDLATAYGEEVPSFGRDYIIPRPFDPRLLTIVATRQLADMAASGDKLSQYDRRPALVMWPIYERAREERQRAVYAAGESETVLRGLQTVGPEGLASPLLVGRPHVIESRIKPPS